MTRSCATLATVVLAALPALAAPRPNSLAVMDTVVLGAPAKDGALVSQTLATYAAVDLKMDVVSKDDVRKLITLEEQKQLLGCESQACKTARPIGEALGVGKLMTSTLVQVGSHLQLTVVVLDVQTNQAVGRATREIATDDDLAETARDLCHFALTHKQRESKGYVRVEASEPGATVIVDGAEYGKTPLKPVRLLQGRHTLRIERKGYIPQESTVDVIAGKTTLFEANLLAKKEVKLAGAGFLPWAWSTAGVAVAAGALSGYFWYQANTEYQTKYLNDPNHTGVPGPITKSDLDKYSADIAFKGNTLAYYGTWSAGVLGGVSVVLFSAYFVAGLGAGGDAPPDPQAVRLEPAPDGLRVRF